MKRSFIVISILLFLTFSISIISSFLSYSSIKLVNEDTDTKTSIYTANLYVTYDNNKQIAINSNVAMPLTKTITIENASDRELKYKLELISVANILDTISCSISKNDEVIKTVAKTVEKAVAGKGFAARYGGDEIAIILPNHNHQQAMYVVEYINHSLSCCMVDDVGAIKASFGIASFPSCSRTQEKLLIQTEQALMMAKHKSSQDGKSNIVSANDFDFWSETALDSFAAVITKKHAQFGINFEEELVDKLHRETITSNSQSTARMSCITRSGARGKARFTKRSSRESVKTVSPSIMKYPSFRPAMSSLPPLRVRLPDACRPEN